MSSRLNVDESWSWAEQPPGHQLELLLSAWIVFLYEITFNSYVWIYLAMLCFYSTRYDGCMGRAGKYLTIRICLASNVQLSNQELKQAPPSDNLCIPILSFLKLSQAMFPTLDADLIRPSICKWMGVD